MEALAAKHWAGLTADTDSVSVFLMLIAEAVAMSAIEVNFIFGLFLSLFLFL
jgi:hypothetical protein